MSIQSKDGKGISTRTNPRRGIAWVLLAEAFSDFAKIDGDYSVG